MNNLVVATKSLFREFLLKDALEINDMVIYESKKDFVVNYETNYLDEFISEFIKKNFECPKCKCKYVAIDNINSVHFMDLLNKIDNINRLIMTGANFLRRNQYLKVSKKIKTRLNIHMGDPNYFRGLDSNLWAMLENQKNHPTVTLHHANLNLDTGEVLFQVKSDKTFAETTLQEFIKFEIESAKKCIEKAILIKELTPVDSTFKNKGIYKGAMNSNEKRLAFKNLKAS